VGKSFRGQEKGGVERAKHKEEIKNLIKPRRERESGDTPINKIKLPPLEGTK